MSVQVKTREIVEVCPNCDAEVVMEWDVETSGYKAFCPHCGGRLMLCDECQHREDGVYKGDCDFGEEGTCRFNSEPLPDVERQLLLLRSDGYLDAVVIIETLRRKVDANLEFENIKDFVRRENDLDIAFFRDQLRCLWTAYSMHYGLSIGTNSYNGTLQELWRVVEKAEPSTSDWNDYASFSDFMRGNLI